MNRYALLFCPFPIASVCPNYVYTLIFFRQSLSSFILLVLDLSRALFTTHLETQLHKHISGIGICL